MNRKFVLKNIFGFLYMYVYKNDYVITRITEMHKWKIIDVFDEIKCKNKNKIISQKPKISDYFIVILKKYIFGFLYFSLQMKI